MNFRKGLPVNEILQAVRVEVAADSTAVQRTPAFVSTSSSGTVTAGKQSIAIANIGSSAGAVLGVSLPAGASISWAANNSDTLDAVAYNATGTTFLITTVS